MENQPLVSVITITRNRGKLIGRCIDSVLNQTYKNIEHIIVDGASDDETDSVVATYNDIRLRFLKLKENWSLEKTYKYGTAQAKGKYICFLDSDDEVTPTWLDSYVAAIDERTDIIFQGAHILTNQGDVEYKLDNHFYLQINFSVIFLFFIQELLRMESHSCKYTKTTNYMK